MGDIHIAEFMIYQSVFAVNIMREQDPVSVAIVNQQLDPLYFLGIAWKVNSIIPL